MRILPASSPGDAVSVTRGTSACRSAQLTARSGGGQTLALSSSLRANDRKPKSTPASSQPRDLFDHLPAGQVD